MSELLKAQITSALKDAMRAQDKRKVGTLRLVTAAIKQIEVDERITVDDQRLLMILDKMVKQRKESIVQFKAAARDDLVLQEEYELAVIQTYLPAPLSDADILSLIDEAIAAVPSHEMGKVMNHLKPAMQGRADMRTVSALVKERLNT